MLFRTANKTPGDAGSRHKVLICQGSNATCEITLWLSLDSNVQLNGGREFIECPVGQETKRELPNRFTIVEIADIPKAFSVSALYD